MEIIDLKNNKRLQTPPKSSVCALGNFDGVHKGHISLLKKAVNTAEYLNIPSVVWTFSYHPQLYKGGFSILTDNNEKCRLFKQYGINFVIFEDFEKVKNLSPSAFVNDILIKTLKCETAVCGFNFKFGKSGSGTTEDLSELMKKQSKNAIILPEVFYKNECISSTRIRNLIENGNTEEAELLLGRPFSFLSAVCKGKQIGRTIGIPTINQFFPEHIIIPKCGIYCSKVILNNKEYHAVSNVGTRPTVSGNYINCETYIIDFNGNLYGNDVRILFYKRLRDEICFNSLEDLKSAIEKDIENSKIYFSKRNF